MEKFKKKRLSSLVGAIAGAGGGKGSGSSRTPREADDTVQSRAMASILDLLGEGKIGGLVNGGKSILLNGTPLENEDGSSNFNGVTWWFRDGSQDQAVIPGFDSVETPKTINTRLKATQSVTFSIDNDEADHARVILKFPKLASVDRDSGDTNGTTVKYKFQISNSGGQFTDVIADGESTAEITLSAKKAGVYYRSYTIALPKPGKTYRVRAIRITGDSTSDYLANETYVDSVGEIVSTSMNYPNSALVGLKINSEQFGNNMPSRAYLVRGLEIRIPSNYVKGSNTYVGNWDGTFQMVSSGNPAWILYDLLTNKRYGLGDFVSPSMIDIGQLYQIGRYCDEDVDDGFGGKEKRFAINTQITSRSDAYKLVQDIAGAFRGMVFWAGGMVHVSQDRPGDPIMLFTNSNVENGEFTYKGSARKDRPSVALITYNNKDDNYKQNIEYVEDPEAVKRYGIRKTESVAFGCTSRGMAHRVGLWVLYTSRMESDLVTFTAGIDTAFLMPGDLALVQDKYRAGRRNSGRIMAATANSITLDSPVILDKSGSFISIMSSDGRIVERDVLETGNVSKVTFKTALTGDQIPVGNAVWIITQPDLKPVQVRVLAVAQGDTQGSFNITAVQNNPTKYEAIDNGATLIKQNTTVLDPTFSTPENLTITEGTYLVSAGNLGVKLIATWEGKSAEYWVSYRRSDVVENWQSARVTEEQFELLNVAENGSYDFQVYGVSVAGRSTEVISATYKVLGTMTPPGQPTGLAAVGDYRNITLTWANPSSVDLDHTNVYYSNKNDIGTAKLLSEVSSTTFTHAGLGDDITLYYWVRAVNKRGMVGQPNSNLGTAATTKDVLSFLQNKITESELGKELLSEIDKVSGDGADSVNARINESTETAKEAVAQEVTDRTAAIKEEATVRQAAIVQEQKDRAAALTKEAMDRASAIAKEASDRAAAVNNISVKVDDSIALEVKNRNQAIADSAKAQQTALAKEVTDRTSAVTALDTKTANALATEAQDRTKAVSDEAAARADALLQEKNNRTAEITNLNQSLQTAKDSLAQQISQVAAGTGEQFDSLKIWYFDGADSEGWVGGANSVMPTVINGWVRPADGTPSGISSPENLGISGNSYRYVKVRIKRVGNPVWSGAVWWVTPDLAGWDVSRRTSVPEPAFDVDGVTTMEFKDLAWADNVRRFRLDFAKTQTVNDYFLIDWIAVGRPTPGAGMAALQNESTARVNADAAEATQRNNLAVQMRGSYDGTDASKVTTGLIFSESQARITADKAEASKREALETSVNDSISKVSKDVSTLNTAQQAQAKDITSLQTSLNNKAEASALTALQTTVKTQGDAITSQGNSITKLSNDLNTTNNAVSQKASAASVTALQNTVTQQGDSLKTASSNITNLQNSLSETNKTIGTKADASAVNDLSNRVTSAEGKISSQSDSITSLSNSLNQLASAGNNVVLDGSFERFTAGQATGYLGLVATADASRNGKISARLTRGSADGSTGNWDCYFPYIKTQPGRVYYLECWVRKDPNNTSTVGYFVFGAGLHRNDGGMTWPALGGIDVSRLTETWVKISGYVTVADGYNDIAPRLTWNGSTTSKKGTSLLVDDIFMTDVTDAYNAQKSSDANSTAISNLTSTVTTQGESISTQSGQITKLNNDLSTVQADVSKKATTAALDSLTSTVTKQGADIASVASRTTSLESGLKTTNDNVAKKADASALTSLQSTVKTQGDTLTSQGSSISNLKNSLDSTNDNVSKKADASALSSLNNTVIQQGNDITAVNDSMTELNANLKDVVRTGNQLVINSSFENGLSNFVIANSGAVSTTTTDKTSGTNSLKLSSSTAPSTIAQLVSVKEGRRYRLSAKVKFSTDAVILDWNNTKLRLGAADGSFIKDARFNDGKVVTDWAVQSLDYIVPVGTTQLSVGINCAIKAGSVLVDEFEFTDITDIFALQQANDANSTALNTLTNTVKTQGSTVTSQGNALTKLQGDLSATSAEVAKKADASALTSLDNRVKATESTVTSQSSAITSLNNSLANSQRGGNNLFPDGTFETYATGTDLTGSCKVVNDFANSGKNALRFRRTSAKGNKSNNDTYLGAGFQTQPGRVYLIEAYLRTDPSSSTANGWINVGLFMSKDAASGNSWGTAFGQWFSNQTEDWKKYTGYVRIPEGKNQARLWMSLPDSGVNDLGSSILIDDIYLLDVTEGFEAQKTADATATAVGSLTTTVEQQGSLITSQGDSITSLKNSLAITDGNVSKKADAAALSSLQSVVTAQGKDITSQGSSITNLNSGFNSLVETGSNMASNASFATDMILWGVEQVTGQNAIVWGANSGDGRPGVVMTKAESNANPALQANNGVYLSVEPLRRYRVSVRAKGISGVYNLMARLYERKQGGKIDYTNNVFTFTSAFDTQVFDFPATSATTDGVLLKVFMYPGAGSVAVDNVSMFDVTDALGNDSNANALSSLNTKVTQQGNTITSQGDSITLLKNNLAATDGNVAKKADATALTNLSNTVKAQGDTLSTASSQITSLQNNLQDVMRDANNTILNPSFEDGLNGYILSSNTGAMSIIPDSVVAGGNVLKISASGSPVVVRQVVQVKPNRRYRLSVTAKFSDDASVSTGAWGNTKIRVGSNDGKNTLLTAVGFNNNSIKTEWAVTSIDYVVPTGVTSLDVSLSGLLQAGFVLLDDFTFIDITEGYEQSATNKATAAALSSLQNTVTSQGDTITAQGSSITSLKNDMTTVKNTKADSSALSSLQNTVTQQGSTLTATGSSVTALQASLARRTVFTLRSAGNGAGGNRGIMDESGKLLWSAGRSYGLITFKREADGSVSIDTTATYDVFNGKASDFNTAVAALARGTYVAVVTNDEPDNGSQNIVTAIESLGGTSEVVNSLYYRDAYILVGQAGIGAGAGLELTAKANGGSNSFIATSIEFINGVMSGLGTSNGVKIRADATASAVSSLTNTVTQQGSAITAATSRLDTLSTSLNSLDKSMEGNQKAIDGLSTTVTKNGADINSLATRTTALETGLTTTNANVALKADTSALNTLSNTVKQQGDSVTAQGNSITNLSSSMSLLDRSGPNLFKDGTFESYAAGVSLNGQSTANFVVTTDDAYTGTKCARARRSAAGGSTSNNDIVLTPYMNVRAGQVFYIEMYVKTDLSSTTKTGRVNVGVWTARGTASSWPTAFVIDISKLTDTWQLMSGYVSVPAGMDLARFWMSFPYNASGNTQGTSVLMSNIVMMEVTEGYKAGKTADATANAMTSLDATVTKMNDIVTSQATQMSAMGTKVNDASSKVDQMSQTLTKANETQAIVNTDLQSKIDAQASANITNQAELNNVSTSMANVKTTQAAITTRVDAMAQTQQTLTAQVNGQSSTIQQTAKATADLQNKINATWSVKMETNSAGQKYAAGIALGIDGASQQSQFLIQADRMALINTSNGNVSTPFVIDSGVTYMNAAYIKNGTIDNAKIAGWIGSSNFVDQRQGWAIDKNTGGFQLNGNGGSGRMTISNNQILIYDNNNILRVRMGLW